LRSVAAPRSRVKPVLRPVLSRRACRSVLPLAAPDTAPVDGSWPHNEAPSFSRLRRLASSGPF